MPGVAGRSGGRNALTRAEHDLRGTTRPDRHGGFTNPEAPKGIPVSPKDLEGDALAEWDRMVGRMETLGSLSVVDDAALYQYARLFAETEALMVDQEMARASVQILEENVAGLKGPDLVAVFQEIAKLRHDIKGYSTSLRQGRMAIRQYLVEFGMTPSARTRVKLPEKPAEIDPLAAFGDDGSVQ